MKHPLENLNYCPRCGSNEFDIDTERSRKCKKCGLTYYANAAAAVAAIIKNKKGEILLTTRAYNPSKGMLDLPGGFVDMDETAEQALIREIKEELNIDVRNPKYLFSLPNEYLFSGITIHTLDLFFEVSIPDSAIIESHDDVSNAQFYDLTNIDIEKIGLHSIRTAIQQLKSI